MGAKPKDSTKDNIGRARVIQAVQSPAGLLALLVLAIEGIFATAFLYSTSADRTYLVLGNLGALVLIILVIGAIIFFRPHALQSSGTQAASATSGGSLPHADESASQQKRLKERPTAPKASKIDYVNVTIHVFLPDWARDTKDEFYQDGSVQHKAFTVALADSSHLIGKLEMQYQAMTESMSAEQLLTSMKELYARKNATYFVMTMSSKVHCIFEAFGRWHLECKREGKRLPVLISTVASAPGLADVDKGILRWYVRSQEESVLLAQYLRWEKKSEHAGIFFVTHRERQMTSHYGTSGRTIFKESFAHLQGRTLDFPVTADDAEENVKKWLKQANDIPNKAAFVIGYGGMMKRTLDALIKNGFAGPIACSSTLTRQEWQPEVDSHDSNIFTVLPRLKYSQEHLGGYDRDVVFFFAKETLRRVIEMTSQDPDAESFLTKWKNGEFSVPEHLPQLCEEHLSNGDSILSLEVVGSDLWRAR